MPREAKLFASSSGSVVRGYLKFRANITPRWIRNARSSRKRIEPEIIQALSGLAQLRKNRPGARVCDRKRRQGIESNLEAMGNGLQQGEFLSRNNRTLERLPSEILFISDVIAELDAAGSAGFETLLCERPRNRPQPATTHRVICGLGVFP